MAIIVALLALFGFALIALAWVLQPHSARLHLAGATCVALALLLATGAVLID